MASEIEATLAIKGGRAYLQIKASPNASKTAVSGIQDDRIRIRVAAAPEDGKANAEIKAFLAKELACPKSAVILESGERSKLKTVSIPVECLPALRELLR